jgi:myo-inositol-1(or 4)-monophosphatase
MKFGLDSDNEMHELSNYLEIALSVVRSAATDFTKNISKYNRIENNLGREVKIRADRELNNLIVEELNKRSSFNIVSEEGDQNVIQGNEFNWILDPLDGSLNYLRSIPIYCISLALWRGFEPVLGVIYDLTQNDIYHGILGTGSFKNNKQIKVSDTKDFFDAVLCTGFPVNHSYSKEKIIEFANNVLKYKKIRLFGSAAMSLSFLASGKIDAYTEENIMLWDVAAGIAIVMAAGGNVMFSQGDVKNSLFVQATNGLLPINNSLNKQTN